MCAAALAEGQTTITGAAMEPEIVDLGQFLIAAGADIAGLGTDTFASTASSDWQGTTYRVIPDRVEAATLLIAAAMTQGTVSVVGARADHLRAVLDALVAAGVDVACRRNKITVHAGRRPRPIDVIARPYPGIPTDVQAQWMALVALADGTSVVADDVFPERMLHAAELSRLGARIERQGRVSIVHGVRRLTGSAVNASDLRASAALVLAGLAAGQETVIQGASQLDRGYERLDHKLSLLGATIVRESRVTRTPVAPDAELVPAAAQP